MPELPEVETVRKGLAKRLVNFKIKNLQVCRERAIASPGGSKLFKENMQGAIIGEWDRRGKYLIASILREIYCSKSNKTSFKNWGWWGVHLRMTGQFQWHQTHHSPCPHTRVRFWNNEGCELRFVDIRSFGQMWWIPSENKPNHIITGLNRLGPEPFSKEFNITYFRECLKGRKRSIKATLLDQSIVAGTGNIYADESLFKAGIDPQKPSYKLTISEIKKLHYNLITVLQESIKEGGTTFSDFRDLEGLNGNYGEQAWVYRRTNKSCRKCGTKIQRQVITGRSTHWCSKCQK